MNLMAGKRKDGKGRWMDDRDNGWIDEWMDNGWMIEHDGGWVKL